MPIEFSDLVPAPQAAPADGPWNDFRKPGMFDDIPTERGPWEDFQKPATFADRFNALPMPPQDSIGGSLKALGTGIGEGVLGLAGLPGDIANLATKGIDYLAGTKTQ